MLVILAVVTLMLSPVQSFADFNVYGFAQLDYIQDFNRVNPDWMATMRASKLPSYEGEFGPDGQAMLSMRQSRLGADATLPTELGDLYTKFEFDLFGVGVDAGQTTIRPRHAYGQLGHVLAGQTNSLFMDGDIWPNIIDYWGPTGMAFFRLPQVRYTTGSDNRTFSVALENPGADFNASGAPAGVAPIANNPYPDITMQVRTREEWGHVQLAGIARSLGYYGENAVGLNPANDPKGSTTGWGFDLTSSIKVRSKDALKLSVISGQGIANYMNDATPDLAYTADGTVEAVPMFAMMAYYDISWSEKYSSTIGYSLVDMTNKDGQAGTDYKKGEYASANFLIYPTKNVFYGVEYLWAQRTAKNGYSDTDSRLQFSWHYNFSTADFKSN